MRLFQSILSFGDSKAGEARKELYCIVLYCIVCGESGEKEKDAAYIERGCAQIRMSKTLTPVENPVFTFTLFTIYYLFIFFFLLVS